MSLNEQKIRALKDKATLLLMVSTAKGQEQAMVDIIKKAVSQNGATVEIAARIDKITPELSGK